MSTVLITGSAGLIGSEAARHFSGLGWDVIGVDNDMRRVFFGDDASTEWMASKLCTDLPNYTHHRSDIRDSDAMVQIVQGLGTSLDLVVHTAAQPSHDWAARAEVETIARLVRADGHRPADEVMSHADIDQKNMLVGPCGPLLCDWDVASPVVPRRELADVALSLAGWEDRGTARMVVAAYRAAGGDLPAFVPADLGASLATSLDWIALNAECALGLRSAPPGRRRLAEALLPDLLAELPRHVEAALGVGRMLNA